MKKASAINAAAIVVLLAAIAAGAVILLQKHPWSREPVEIRLERPATAAQRLLQVYIDGAVAWPGWYMLNGETTIEGLLATAGGLTNGVERSTIAIRVSTDGVGESPQRISINRASPGVVCSSRACGIGRSERVERHAASTGGRSAGTYKQVAVGVGVGVRITLREVTTCEKGCQALLRRTFRPSVSAVGGHLRRASDPLAKPG